MANTELDIVRLKDDFYRDGFYRFVFSIVTITIAVLLLIAVSLYLEFSKPKPVVFSVGQEWRMLPPVPLDKPYLNTADLLQWVSDVVPASFHFDFINYSDQLKDITQYYTNPGWKKFLDIVNTYANYNTIQNNKMFMSAEPGGAPTVINEGVPQGRYAWLIQIPIQITYIGASDKAPTTQSLTLQMLVVRVSTLNNLNGVGIDDIVVVSNKSQGTT